MGGVLSCICQKADGVSWHYTELPLGWALHAEQYTFQVRGSVIGIGRLLVELVDGWIDG